MLDGGGYREVGNKRRVTALYWEGHDAHVVDQAGLVDTRIHVGTKTTFYEPVGDFYVCSHKHALCMAWGTV